MRKVAVAIAGSILVVVVLIILVRIRKAELARLQPPKIYPVVVKTFTPHKGKFYLTLTGLGVIESSANVDLSTNASGRVLFVKKLGERVKKGEVVARIDDTALKAKLNSAISELDSLKSKLSSAKIALKNAILSHKRTKELLKVKGASIEQYQREATQIAALRSNVVYLKSSIKKVKNSIRELENMITYTVLKTPISGIVSKKFLNVGDMALPGRPIIQISSTSGKYLMIALPQSIEPKGVIFDGKFYKVFSLDSTFNSLNEYKASINTNLAAGSRVKVDVVVFKGEAIKLPFDAVLNNNGKNLVFIYKDHRAIPKPIRIIATGEEGIATDSYSIAGKQLIVAKPDTFIRLLGGVKVVKE